MSLSGRMPVQTVARGEPPWRSGMRCAPDVGLRPPETAIPCCGARPRASERCHSSSRAGCGPARPRRTRIVVAVGRPRARIGQALREKKPRGRLPRAGAVVARRSDVMPLGCRAWRAWDDGSEVGATGEERAKVQQHLGHRVGPFPTPSAKLSSHQSHGFTLAMG